MTVCARWTVYRQSPTSVVVIGTVEATDALDALNKANERFSPASRETCIGAVREGGELPTVAGRDALEAPKGRDQFFALGRKLMTAGRRAANGRRRKKPRAGVDTSRTR